MNTALFYDTETQCLPLFSLPSEHADQPHIVQLGACLVDLDTRKVINTLDLVIRPDGWEIPIETTEIHGITTAHAMAVGVDECLALELFLEMWAAADRRIGHNQSFDARIVRIGMKRNPQLFREEECEAWKHGKAECTQLLATPICKLPPTEKMKAAKRFHHKSANLREAYKHFTGSDLEGAHSAMVDVKACMAVYFAIQDATQPVAA